MAQCPATRRCQPSRSSAISSTMPLAAPLSPSLTTTQCSKSPLFSGYLTLSPKSRKDKNNQKKYKKNNKIKLMTTTLMD